MDENRSFYTRVWLINHGKLYLSALQIGSNKVHKMNENQSVNQIRGKKRTEWSTKRSYLIIKNMSYFRIETFNSVRLLKQIMVFIKNTLLGNHTIDMSGNIKYF